LVVFKAEARQSMVPRAGDFKLNAVRLVAFTPNLGDFDPSAVLAAVLGTFAKRFDGSVQAIPLPEDVPPDFPRIQLASRDGSWGFVASPSSIASSWSRKEEVSEEAGALSRIVAACREPIEHHVRKNGVRVGRLGLVIARLCQVERPAKVLVERFCRDDMKDPSSPDAPLRNSLNFEIHNHKRYEFPAGFTVNSWVRCRTGALSKDGSPVLMVEQDINTLTEEMRDRTFIVDEITAFYDTGVNEAETIFEKYFP